MNMLDNLRRGELKRLLLHRRAASKVDVYNVVEDILGERVKWTSTALGRRMQLTFEEKVRLGIRTLRCIDRNANMMRLYYLERRRERDRRRAKKMRGQMAKEMNGLSARTRKLAAMLSNDWMSGYRLVEILEKKWRLKHNAARQAMRRAVIELREAESGFEMKAEPGPHGGYQTFMRLQPRGNAANTGISEPRSARNADKIRAARSGDSNLSSATCGDATKPSRLTEEMQENQVQLAKGTIH